jgi:Fe-S cluster assembly ATP-binding protein
MKPALSIHNATVSRDGAPILHNLSLDVAAGERVAIMGPNGSGKSTLSMALLGSPECELHTGTITVHGLDISTLAPEERAAAGLFIGFQHPPMIPGVSVVRFLHTALTSLAAARGEKPVSFASCVATLKTHMRALDIPWSFAERAVNVGFSGGERKRLEILQLLMLKPSVVVLDEIDSGLDVDALRSVSAAISIYQESNPDVAVIVITHYQRLLELLPVNRVLILEKGSITRSGGPELAHTIEATGYTPL